MSNWADVIMFIVYAWVETLVIQSHVIVPDYCCHPADHKLYGTLNKV